VDDRTDARQLARDLAHVSARLAESERRLAEIQQEHEQIRRREELYRQLVENSQGLICKHDLDGNLLYVSPASAMELGYPPDAGARRNLRDFLAPSVRPFLDASLARVREKEADRGTLRLVSRDGQERLWAYRNALHRDADGRPYVVGHAVDITDRAEAEALLRESEARHRAVIDALAEGVLFVDAGGTAQSWNPSAERILGLTREQFRPGIASMLAGEVQADDGSALPRQSCPDAITLTTGQPCANVVLGVRRPAGERVWISVSSRALTRPGEAAPYGAVLSLVDVTDRRQADMRREQDLREALAKVRVLGGTIPICASCKKIRDPRGAWWPLEVYIRDHSEAEFSHGLCPPCAAEALRGFEELGPAQG
jgi:PAS domain S-box-containing protein